ncbi:MAG: CRISPR-associated protein Csx19 [Anaerolineae bacterium]|nr:CRISPR-associated protein Csx19 [Anaerolineae bacterium]
MSNPEEIKPAPTDENVREWLAGQMKDNALSTLLAFADDGGIWGRHDGNSLTIARDVDPSCPDLRGKTLQEARAFSEKMEVRLFHDELGEWKAWKLKDEGEVIKESQILWGDKLAEDQLAQSGFLRLMAERKGIPPQLIPVDDKFDESNCVRLEVHHLVKYDEATGEAYIAISRLAGLSVGEKGMEVEHESPKA